MKERARAEMEDIAVNQFTDLGVILTGDELPTTYPDHNIEDSIVIKAHDHNYYMFLTDGYDPGNKIIYTKSSTLDFAVQLANGTAYNIAGIRPRVVVYNSSEEKYYMIYSDVLNGCIKSVVTTKANFPTGWENSTILIDKGTAPTDWDHTDVTGGGLFKYNDIFYLFYRGVLGTDKKIGFATNTDLKSTFTKSSQNPVYTPTGSWCTSFDLRGATELQFNAEGIIAIEGAISGKASTWENGWIYVRNLTGTVELSEASDNPINLTGTNPMANPFWLNTGNYGEENATKPHYLYVGEKGDGINWHRIRLFKYESIHPAFDCAL